MPPNPDRQAKLAARREAMANDPELQDAMRTAGAKVLAGSKTSDAPAPRPLMPNFYGKGGKAKAKGGRAGKRR